MFAKRVPPQSEVAVCQLFTALPPAHYEECGDGVAGTLRNGLRICSYDCSGSPEGVINTHNYQALCTMMMVLMQNQ